MLLSKKKSQAAAAAAALKGNRFLITITVLGSAGPIRFIVNDKDPVAAIMDIALKTYSRQGRLPVLGSNLNEFLLYCPSVGRTEALSPWETIGSIGCRNFMLCKKPQMENPIVADGASTLTPTRRGSGNWKNWFNKSLNLRISSH